MALADVGTTVGLLFDCAGAILLVGIDWKYSFRIGEYLNPEFVRLDNALDTLGNHPREALKPEDDGFDELFDILSLEPINALPVETWERARIEPPDGPTGKATFVFEQVDTAANVDASENHKMRMELVKKLTDSYVQKWFIKCAVLLLVIGFFLQIAATLLPYFL